MTGTYLEQTWAKEGNYWLMDINEEWTIMLWKGRGDSGASAAIWPMVLSMVGAPCLLLSADELSPYGEKQLLRAPVFLPLSLHKWRNFWRMSLIGPDSIGCPPLAQSVVAGIGRKIHGRKWWQLRKMHGWRWSGSSSYLKGRVLVKTNTTVNIKGSFILTQAKIL